MSRAQAWPPAPPFERAPDTNHQLPSSVQAETWEGGYRVTFSLPSTVGAERVHLAGSFNGWNGEALGFTREADGRWKVALRLGAGIHSYKFVLDGRTWIQDEGNEESDSDGLGGMNSILRLGALGHPEDLLRRLQPGQIVAEGCEHDPALSLFLQRAGAGRMLLRYRTLEGDVDGVLLCFQDGQRVPLAVIAAVKPFVYWQAQIEVPPDPVDYVFVLRDGDLEASDSRVFHLDPGSLPGFQTPEWAKHATWYQVFVDRFRSGRDDNQPDPVRPWTSEWYTPSPWEAASGQSFYEHYVFARLYGGDLTGLASQLDYIQSLGVTALYLNPIFQASTAHKYNATDFRHVDTRFGAGEDYAEATAGEDLLDPETWIWTPSDRVFLDFLQECHRRGLKVILDGVFNHVGTRHPAFQDVLAKGRDSRFADWFEIAEWDPVQYVGWAGFAELPVFTKSPEGFECEAVQEHIFAITRRWMDPDGDGDPSDGIDGWRLDVPMELAQPFWERWRQLVKSINPDSYLAGEVWDRADPWLDGRTFDGVMNYPFTQAAVDWIGKGAGATTPTKLDQALAELRLAYPAEATYALMNLVDSHDTDRVASMVYNPGRAFDRGNREQNSPDYQAGKPSEEAYRRVRLLALFQMTYVGAPMIYYGDEVGMWGSDDPNNRKPMLWSDLEPYEAAEENHVHAAQLAYYRRIGALRRDSKALRIGGYVTVLADDESDVFVFLREFENEQVLVALNASEQVYKPRIELLNEEGWQLVLSDSDDEPADGLPAVSGRVWARRMGAG